MNAMDPSQLRRISKRMSWLLRHGADDVGLAIDPEGYVAITDVLRTLKGDHPGISRQVLAAVIHQVEPDKQRFRIEGEWIRANYGHSFDSKVKRTATEPPETLLYGTSRRSLPEIFRTGLRPMERQFVHLTTDPALAAQIGARHGRARILQIAAGVAHRHQVPFYRANSKFWLADAIPAVYLSVWAGQEGLA